MKNIFIIYFLLLTILTLSFNLSAQPLHPVPINATSKIEVSTDSLKWKDYPSGMQMISATKAVVLQNDATLALYDISTGQCLKKTDLTKLNYKAVYKELVALNNKPRYLSYDSIMKVRDTLPFCSVSNFIFQDGDLIVPICLLNQYTGPIPWKQHQKKYNFSRFFAVATLDTFLKVKSLVTMKFEYPPFETMNDPDFTNGFCTSVLANRKIYYVRNLVTRIPAGRAKYAERFTSFQPIADHYEELLTIGYKVDSNQLKNKRLFSKAHYYFIIDSLAKGPFVSSVSYFTDGYSIGHNQDSVCVALNNTYRPDSALIGKFITTSDNKCLYYILNDWNKQQQKFISYLVKYDLTRQKSVGLYTFSADPSFTSLDFIDDKLVYVAKHEGSYNFATVTLP